MVHSKGLIPTAYTPPTHTHTKAEHANTRSLLQWRNRRGGRGAECPPRDFWPGNFCWRIGKKRQGKKGKRVENWKWKQENVRKRGEDLFFFFFFFFFLLFTFENDENLFWVYQNGNFLPGKSFSRREKNQEKWLCPLRKICLLRPCSPHGCHNNQNWYEVSVWKYYTTEFFGFFHRGSGESVKNIGGKTNELLCNKSWRINTCMVEDGIDAQLYGFMHCIEACCIWNWLSSLWPCPGFREDDPSR